jgi:hypothetical protein
MTITITVSMAMGITTGMTIKEKWQLSKLILPLIFI